MKLNLTADEVLTTTRAVRKRLDFDRPVEREVLMECLDIALQAPTGSNRQGWQWIFVQEAAAKQALADLYGKAFDAYAQTIEQTPFPEGDLRLAQRPGVYSSASYLRDNFHRAPVMMIPMIEGRFDKGPSAMQAGAWGSILPAVWSFLLAARERGLGSAWTTLHLVYEKDAADVLGVPYDQYTQAGLFPIAYTKGTDFKPAQRIATDGLVHFERW
jgi:nitroreductase